MLSADATAARGDSPFLGVLVSNLGTPDAPTPAALKRYLAEFLSDPCVVELPGIIWRPVLHGLVLPFRPKRSAAAYARIWTPAGSPLLINTLDISHALQTALQTRVGKPVVIETGMRYGTPSLAAALEKLLTVRPHYLVFLSLYPQYARATAGSTRMTLNNILTGHASASAGKFVDAYYQHPGFIAALAASVREYWQAHGRGRLLLISFHGIPERAVQKGDPYAEQCAYTARELAAALALQPQEWKLVFQSRFGKAKWLRPYTETTLRELAADGVQSVDVICPGFAADCLETLEEIALRYAEAFRAAGGKELRYIPALNSRSDHIRALADLVMARISA
ncbi:MAG: ferrochelatase [Gammaproteobacteria bacterium]